MKEGIIIRGSNKGVKVTIIDTLIAKLPDGIQQYYWILLSDGQRDYVGVDDVELVSDSSLL